MKNPLGMTLTPKTGRQYLLTIFLSQLGFKFVEIFTNTLDKHAPWKTIYFNNNIQEWVTREILANFKKRGQLYKKAKKETTLENDNFVTNR